MESKSLEEDLASCKEKTEDRDKEGASTTELIECRGGDTFETNLAKKNIETKLNVKLRSSIEKLMQRFSKARMAEVVEQTTSKSTLENEPVERFPRKLKELIKVKYQASRELKTRQPKTCA